MKNPLIALYLIILHAALGLVLWKSDFLARLDIDKQPELTKHYHRMVSYHRSMDPHIPEGATIFIGDSLTQALPVSAIATPAFNYGIGNDTTYGVLQRIPHYKSLGLADSIVLAIGINDMRYRSNIEILKNYRQILDLLPLQTPIFINSVLPIAKGGRIGANNERISALNKELETLAESQNNITFINSTPALGDSAGHLIENYHRGDGVHLSDRGNAIWIKTLQSGLRKNTK